MAGVHVTVPGLKKPGTPQLSAILLTQFGGDATTPYFSLPDLRGRLPLCADALNESNPTCKQEDKGGALTTNLVLANMPAHGHAVNVRNADSDRDSVSGNVIGTPSDNHYGPASAQQLVKMNEGVIGKTGTAAPISNIQPVLGLVFAIALTGVVPGKT